MLYQLCREIVGNMAHFKPSSHTIIVLCHFILQIFFICLTNKVLKSVVFKGDPPYPDSSSRNFKKLERKVSFPEREYLFVGPEVLLSTTNEVTFSFLFFFPLLYFIKLIFSVWLKSLYPKHKEECTHKTRAVT